jgi:tRNA-specific 2-thiouridylase
MDRKDRKILVLMSGGVDSAVAAAILRDQGYEVTGVTLNLWGGKDQGSSSHRPDNFEKNVEDARRVADELKIPHRVLDLRDRFLEEIVEGFVGEYARGRTPNPCVICNERVKFRSLLTLAEELDVTLLASGHYARIGRGGDGQPFLRKARDTSKDQSYFLYRLPREILARTIFPLGEMTKDEVRSLATRMDLSVADRDDSQEICFIPGGDLAGFLEARLFPGEHRPGIIKSTGGEPLGHHRGIHLFTIGQRRGLGVATGKPRYVVAMEAGTGTILVGDDEELFSSAMDIVDLSWADGAPGEGVFKAKVRIRYRHREAPAEIAVSRDRVTVTFDEPQRAITPGQSGVFYDGDRVLGGGIIDRLA